MAGAKKQIDPVAAGAQALAAQEEALGAAATRIMGLPEGAVALDNTGRAVRRYTTGWYLVDDAGDVWHMGFGAVPTIAEG